MFLEQFLKYIQFEKRYSNHTLIAYQNDLQQYFSFLNQYNCCVEEANHQIVRLWMVNLMEDGIDPRSINRKISTLRSFYKFLLQQKLIDKNPVVKIQATKTAKKLPIFITDDKLNELLDKDIFEVDFSGIRDKLIIELLFGTGIRLSELTGLKINDVFLQEKTIKVLGKRNKERIIPLNQSLIQLLPMYLLEKEKQHFSDSSEILIVTNTGLPVYTKFVYRIVHKYLTYVSTQSKKSPHILRHSFATSLLNKGADINAIKDLLGHANLSATQVYTHNSIERLKSIYKQAHPKA